MSSQSNKGKAPSTKNTRAGPSTGTSQQSTQRQSFRQRALNRGDSLYFSDGSSCPEDQGNETSPCHSESDDEGEIPIVDGTRKHEIHIAKRKTQTGSNPSIISGVQTNFGRQMGFSDEASQSLLQSGNFARRKRAEAKQKKADAEKLKDMTRKSKGATGYHSGPGTDFEENSGDETTFEEDEA
ncbi:uncharacterized protein L201_002493 [Kwoniella dendrophila CBS 6074]|uniref:Uncharacterized protein n=1 Tax=Kwoniella dendrophila CBS 6074 TaxID=1295534 RepID=A0AAX4JRT1_9TREE